MAAERVARSLRLLVDEWRWPVVPGVHLTRSGECSCGTVDCPEPGAHPVDAASWLAASSDSDRVREWWLACPLAAIVLPIGWHVDVIDAPERGGREALGRLEMMGYRPAPVLSTASGRLLFLVAAGARRTAEFAERGRPRSRMRFSPSAMLPTQPGPETGLWLGGDSSGPPDIVVRRRGVLVLPPIGPEPPGVNRWLIEPDPVRHPLPRAEDVLGPIVLACRDVASHRPSRSRLAGSRAARTAGASRAVSAVRAASATGPPGRAAHQQPAAATSRSAPDRAATLPTRAAVSAATTAAATGDGHAIVPVTAGAMPASTAARAAPDAARAAGGAGRAAAGSSVGSVARSAGGPAARTCEATVPGVSAAAVVAGAAAVPTARRATARRPAATAAGRARTDQRLDAEGAAWKERLRLIQPDQPRAPG